MHFAGNQSLILQWVSFVFFFFKLNEIYFLAQEAKNKRGGTKGQERNKEGGANVLVKTPLLFVIFFWQKKSNGGSGAEGRGCNLSNPCSYFIDKNQRISCVHVCVYFLLAFFILPRNLPPEREYPDPCDQSSSRPSFYFN